MPEEFAFFGFRTVHQNVLGICANIQLDLFNPKICWLAKNMI